RVAKQTERSVMMAQQNGLYRADIEPSVVAALISGAYDRLARELIKQPKRPPIEAWSEQVPDVFLNGLLATGTAIPRAAGARSKAPSKAAMPKIPDQRVTINARRRRTTKAANDEGSPGAASRKRGVRAQ
ncbi:MAG TPA: TetR/AcrR family transcriptional regulator, partial [Polyangiaceae bacterium]|nr:TetR/AcrR family transcriptional regulator [Polyangiaceae bacterium]